jgi:hypothetical protein
MEHISTNNNKTGKESIQNTEAIISTGGITFFYSWNHTFNKEVMTYYAYVFYIYPALHGLMYLCHKY